MSSFLLENISLNKQEKIARIKYDHFYNIELVPNKPEDELVVYPDHANIYNHRGEKFGELMNTPLVYASNIKRIYKDSLIMVRIYGWVWNESLDGHGQLIVPENIRYRANSHIIARLYTGTLLDTIYTNELHSWMLIYFAGFVPTNFLLTPEDFDDIPGIKKFFSNVFIKTPNTKRTGGVSVKPPTRPIIQFEDLIWPVRLVFIIILYPIIIWFSMRLYFLWWIHDKRKSRMTILILLVSGIITGCALHWNFFL
jgi:hypothetical protein